MAAGGAAGALAATEITGSAGAAGLPLGVLVAASGLGAVAISSVTRLVGRRAALAAGYVVGVMGAATTVGAIGMASFGLLLTGSAGLGVANAAVFLARYAVPDEPGDGHRGRAMGLVLAAAAVGGVAGLNLLGPSGAMAHAIGLPRVAGLYLVAAPAFALAALLLGWENPRTGGTRPALDRPLRSPIRIAASPVASTRRALIVLAATNLAMVATLAIAPVHMVEHGHGLTVVGIVVSVHVVCMFALAPLWGRLGDAAGHHVVIALGAGLLIASGIAGAVVNTTHAGAMTAVLALLGLGWSAGVVGASALLAESVPARDRPRVEGAGEVAMSIAAGGGAPLAGIVVAFGSFAALCLAAAVVGAGALVAGWPGVARRTVTPRTATRPAVARVSAAATQSQRVA
jgi:MFS family permease